MDSDQIKIDEICLFTNALHKYIILINNIVNYCVISIMYEKFEKIRSSGLKVLDIADIGIILDLKPPSARVIASRMVKKGVLSRLKRDLYLLSGVDRDVFEIANKLVVPSYISFETALNYWGLTTQIPTTITSAARRSKQLAIAGEDYSYSNLPVHLFHSGVIRERSFFIANPEKTILDMLYYASLGKRSITFDTLTLEKIDREKLSAYLGDYPLRTKELAQEMFSWI